MEKNLKYHFVQAADEVHASAVVEQQWLVVAAAGADDVVVQLSRTDHLAGSDVVQCDAVFADDEQLSVVVEFLEAERLADACQWQHFRLVLAGDDQLAVHADGKDFSVLVDVDVAEAVGVVPHQPLGH